MATNHKKTSAEGAGVKPVMPKIINIMDIKARPKQMTLVHFTAAQWKSVISRLKPTDEFPQKSVLLEAAPLPGGSGDMLLGGQCRYQRGTVCYWVPDPIREPGRRPEQFDIGWTCMCQDIPENPRPTTLCRLRFGRFPQFKFSCDATNCPAGCDFRWTRQQNGIYALGCVCKR